MHNIEKLGLQVFAAPAGLTGQDQIQVRAREKLTLSHLLVRICRHYWIFWESPE